MRLQIICDGEPKLDIEVDQCKLTTRFPAVWHRENEAVEAEAAKAVLPDIELTARAIRNDAGVCVNNATGPLV
ncbi:hypothetical protein A5761_15070 [Mycolicibacterium setense]|uniref:hypothetical protein n=1 Tax=Mycolicibacterium setense TaxID=431269 RepID=UPI0007EC085C|nr:hypothetical protein [Mycolicibacterium setense]OBB15061.1 hypothetical protein A5761_15070 [Mycolicibacterium setense]